MCVSSWESMRLGNEEAPAPTFESWSPMQRRTLSECKRLLDGVGMGTAINGLARLASGSCCDSG